MTSAVLVAIGCAVLAYLAIGARTSLWLLLAVAYVPFLTLDPSQGGFESLAHDTGDANFRVKLYVRVATSVLFVVLLLLRRGALRELGRPALLVPLAFAGWALLGLFNAAQPEVSLARLCELVTFFLAGVVLLRESSRWLPSREIARHHALALVPLPLATLWFARENPDIAAHVSADGLMRLGHQLLDANVLGFTGAILCVWATFELREPRQRLRGRVRELVVPAAVLALSLGILVYARSRTALIATLAGQALLWCPLYGLTRRRAAMLVLLVAGLVLVAASSVEGITAWFLRGDELEVVRSGTGRTELWKALLVDSFPRAPIFGHGYLNLYEDGRFPHAGVGWNDAHNTFLFALIATGLPGALLVVAMAALPLRAALQRAFRGPHPERAGWLAIASFQLVVLVTSCTGFGFTGYPNAVMLFHMTLYAVCVVPVASAAPARARGPWPAVRAPGIGVGVGLRAPRAARPREVTA